MEDKQLREEVSEVVLVDGEMHLSCRKCGTVLSAVPCSEGCPHVAECGDYQMHFAQGIAWCPLGLMMQFEHPDEEIEVRRVNV